MIEQKFERLSVTQTRQLDDDCFISSFACGTAITSGPQNFGEDQSHKNKLLAAHTFRVTEACRHCRGNVGGASFHEGKKKTLVVRVSDHP